MIKYMDSEKIKSILEETKKTLEKDFSEEKIEKLQTDSLQRNLLRFKKDRIIPLIKDIDHAIEVVKSPVHIGFLGRYSHGKTALLNVLFNLSDEEKLPEGEGVVTSKVTYASFDKDCFDVQALEIKKGGSVKEINLEDLRRRVGRNVDSYDTSGVDYFQMTLPTEGKGDFAKLFADKRIHLVDMPGLGGQYFSDRTETRRYLREMDMVIAVISMLQIKESALNIATMLEDLTIPVIPVLTFCDKWNESDLYEGCDDENEAVARAMDMVQEYFPTIKNIDNIIAVSSYTKTNIPQLRSLILNSIELSTIAISKARNDISPVYKKKLAEYKGEFNTLKANISTVSEGLSSMLKELFKDSLEKDENIVTEVTALSSVKRIERRFPDDVKRSVSSFQSDYRDRVGNLRVATTPEEYSARKGAFKKAINGIIESSNDILKSRFVEYLNVLNDEIQEKIESLHIGRDEKKDLSDKVSEVITYYSEDFSIKECFNYTDISTKETAAFAAYQAKVGVDFLKQMMSDHSTLIMALLGVGLMSVGFLPLGLGKLASLLGAGMIGVAVIVTLTKRPNKTALFKETLENEIIPTLESAFDPIDAKEKVQQYLDSALGKVKEELENNLSSSTKEYNKDKQFLADNKRYLDDTLEELKENLNDILSDIRNESK